MPVPPAKIFREASSSTASPPLKLLSPKDLRGNPPVPTQDSDVIPQHVVECQYGTLVIAEYDIRPFMSRFRPNLSKRLTDNDL
jgi:hypothetical protein